jgi:hypothetical protein
MVEKGCHPKKKPGGIPRALIMLFGQLLIDHEFLSRNALLCFDVQEVNPL